MDPSTLAATITGLLAPYLAKAGEVFLEGAAAKLPEMVGKLWEKISDRFKGNPAAAGAADDLAMKPDDPDNQQAFELQLKKALKEDEEFANALLEMVNRSREAGFTEAGGVAASDGGIGVGKIEIGGDVSSSSIVIGNKNEVKNG